MLTSHIPLARPKPDAGEFIDILMGRKPQVRTPLVEYIVDDVVMKPIVENLLGRQWVAFGSDRDSQQAYLDNFIEFWYRLGYDFVRFEQSLPFPESKLIIPDAAPGSPKSREWADEHQSALSGWDDFERIHWPTIEEFDFFAYDYLNAHLPDGMGLISSHGGGIFEHITWMMSLEGFCSALVNDPALVKTVADKLGELMIGFYHHLLDLDRLIAVFPGDDMGYNVGTLVSPAALRTYFLPWHKKFASLAHGKGLPYFLHSCGNLEKIMKDLIDDVQIDGKHSYENNIIPVQDFQSRYGNRIAVLGGLDLNVLGASSPESVRAHTRALIETCGGRGRYAIGSGNSIPSYVPVENYLSMVDEAIEISSRHLAPTG
ncbi:MAG: uroporphyrinogen decarboxylase family protein [Bacteroidota bacterium]|jgi:uroporphyrinogen decarboxylase